MNRITTSPGVIVEELADVVERVDHLRRPELADRVAEEDLLLPLARRADPDAAGEPLGRSQGRGGQRLDDLVAVAALGLEVGPHPAVGALRSPSAGRCRNSRIPSWSCWAMS